MFSLELRNTCAATNVPLKNKSENKNERRKIEEVSTKRSSPTLMKLLQNEN